MFLYIFVNEDIDAITISAMVVSGQGQLTMVISKKDSLALVFRRRALKLVVSAEVQFSIGG